MTMSRRTRWTVLTLLIALNHLRIDEVYRSNAIDFDYRIGLYPFGPPRYSELNVREVEWPRMIGGNLLMLFALKETVRAARRDAERRRRTKAASPDTPCGPSESAVTSAHDARRRR